jgi:hypothetical protein
VGTVEGGKSISDMSRALKKHPGSIDGMLNARSEVAPPHRCRSRQALTPDEREETSRGAAPLSGRASTPPGQVQSNQCVY